MYLEISEQFEISEDEVGGALVMIISLFQSMFELEESVLRFVISATLFEYEDSEIQVCSNHSSTWKLCW